MTKDQRELIVHALSAFYDLKQIACLPDADLFEQYQKMCKTGETDLIPLERPLVPGT